MVKGTEGKHQALYLICNSALLYSRGLYYKETTHSGKKNRLDHYNMPIKWQDGKNPSVILPVS